MLCINCHTEMKCAIKTHHYKESGLDNIYLEGIEVCSCEKCGEEEIGIPCIPELHRVIAESLIIQKQPLSGHEVRFLRKNAGMSAKRFAAIIAVDSSTLSRWENENQTISTANDRLIRMIYCAVMDIPTKRIVEDEFALISSKKSEIPLINLPIAAWAKNQTGGCAIS